MNLRHAARQVQTRPPPQRACTGTDSPFGTQVGATTLRTAWARSEPPTRRRTGSCHTLGAAKTTAPGRR